MVAHIINFSTGKAEAGRALSLRSAWSTQGVQGQTGLSRDTLPQKKKKIRLMAMQSVRKKTSLWALKGTLKFQY